MRKPHNFNVMSNRKCACGKAIKQNVIDKQPNAALCYGCSRVAEASKGNEISTAREVKTGKKIGRKKGNYVID